VKTVGRRGTFAAIGFLLALGFLLTLVDAVFAQGSPFGAGPRAAPPPPPADGVTGWIFAKQAEFNFAIRNFVRQAKSDGTAYWSLLGVSFLYGIFHALGPGHGKAVISSYVVANNETRWRGVVLSFASALLQAVTAVLFVGIAKFLFGATQKMMCDAERVIEIASYAFIALIGVRLLWVKGRGFLATLGDLRRPAVAVGAAVTPHGHGAEHHDHHHHHHHDHAHAHPHDHAHDSDSAWAHAHGPEPSELGGAHWLRRGLSAVLAVGIRPCSGAIIVLIFALSQGIFWAGVEATFVMALGTGITVAAIATLALIAKDFAKHVADRRGGLGMLVMRGVEVAAAGLIIAFGLLLLAGYMWSERLPLC
jgi:nickel/cobalt transporter (NicO) family protein